MFDKNYKSYFTLKELTQTNTGLPNFPSTWEHVVNLIQLEYTLSAIRADYGDTIIVNSAFRTPEVNSAVKGSENSYHLKGRAADIRPCNYSSPSFSKNLQRLADVVKPYEEFLKEVIYYPTFVHIAI